MLDLIIKKQKIENRKAINKNIILLITLFALCFLSLMIGNTNYSAKTVIDVLLGKEVSGAGFIINTLRLPRAIVGMLAGFAFGISGSIFQRMLRNPLASPDVLGVSSGSSVSAVFCILILRQSGAVVFIASVLSALAVTLVVYLLSQIKGYTITKIVLIGIAMQAMLRSIISYMQIKANVNDLGAVIRWLSGDLSTVSLEDAKILCFSLLIILPILLCCNNQLKILEFGEDVAKTLGVNTVKARLIQLISSVMILAIATAITGPIAFVSFISGPIANKINFKNMITAGLVGSIIVVASEIIGQNFLSVKMPVGVITGIVGTPYLIYLIVSQRREGA